MEINYSFFSGSHSPIVCGMQIDFSQQSLNTVASGLLLVLSKHHKKSKFTEMKSLARRNTQWPNKISLLT